MLVETGISKLDEMLGGGIREGASVLFLSSPGIDPTIFLLQMNYNALLKGQHSIYYVDNIFPEKVKERTKDIKLWDERLMEKTIFVDGFSSKVGLPSQVKYFLKKYELGEITATVERAIKDNINKLFFFFEAFEGTQHHGESAIKLLDDLIAVSIALNTTCAFSLVDWNLPKFFIDNVKKRFDYIIKIDSVEEKFLTRNYFHIEKSPAKSSEEFVPFRVGMDGIGIYVPKIVITGPFHSGKSSFIQKVSTRAVSVDRLGTTVALDHGYIDYAGIGADLFGTPGQERFEFMLDILRKEMFGVILIVDSTDPGTFDRAMEMLEYIRKEAVPFVVVANKQDIENALSSEEVKKRIGVDAPVIGTSAVTGQGCLGAVKKLIELVIKRGAR